MAGIPLAAAIGELRKQIIIATEQARDEKVRFRLGPIELELQIELEASAEIEGGVKAWVLSIGASGTERSTKTHRVKLTLEPRTASDGDVDVNRQSR